MHQDLVYCCNVMYYIIIHFVIHFLVTDYTTTAINMMVSKVSGDSDCLPMPIAPPPLCHNAERPELSVAVASYVSRFNKDSFEGPTLVSFSNINMVGHSVVTP